MMNCNPALEQLREPDALVVCGGVARHARALAAPFKLMDGGAFAALLRQDP